MHLNTLTYTPGAKTAAKRLGRGVGSGLGKTSGKGHKGQYARAGGYHKVGFEGGQMPMQRRLPKFGFNSKKALVTGEIRLDALNNIEGDVVDIVSLKAAGFLSNTIQHAKVVLAGKLNRALTVHGVRVTKGAQKAIEASGGKIEA